MTTASKFKAMAVLLAVAAFPTLAMEAPEAPGAAQGVEEIEVIGQRSLLALRMQVEAAQDEVHLLFNDLNTDDAFDIVCKEEERLFSRMRQKNCMPQYAWDARAKEGRAFADSQTSPDYAEARPAYLDIGVNAPRMREQMVEAVSHSPELFDAIVRHANLMKELSDAQATYFGEEAQEEQ